MTTVVIIGAVAGVLIILAFGAVRLAQRGGAARGTLTMERDKARAEAASAKAVAEELAKPVTRDDVARSLERGEF
jgi:hypothetical protein